MLRVVIAEAAKLKRSTMPFWTAAVVLVAPTLTIGGMRATGCTIADTGWSAFMHSAPQMVAGVWGTLLFSLVTAYLFGREYSDGTVHSVFVLPLRRETVVLSKAIVAAAWVVVLVVWGVVAHALYGIVHGVPGFAWAPLADAVADSLVVTALILPTLPLIALLTMVGRGYAAPMVFASVAATAGIGLAEAGYGRWFPWAMPMSYTRFVVGPPLPFQPLTVGSLVVLGALFVAGVAAVLWYVRRADVVAP
jgi:ABC-2 type transport system permease protein